MQRIRLGIIGPGLIWDLTHRDIVKGMNKALEVRALSARSEETREKARGQFPEAKVYQDYHDLIGSDEVDAVVVLTPIPMNAPVAIEVLNAEKHAIMEKPMATSVGEANELIEAEKKSSGNVYILEQFPHKSVIPEVHTLLAEGILGKPLHYEYVAHSRLEEKGGEGKRSWGDTSWRQESAFPLGNIFDGGIHNLSLLQMLFGPPTEVTSIGSNVRPTFGEYDTISSVLSYRDGMIGAFCHSGYLPEVKNYLIIRGDGGAAEINDRWIRVHLRDGSEDERRVHYENESVRMWREIASAIHDGKQGSYSTTQSLNDLRVLEAIGTSLSRGQRVEL